MSQRRGFTLVEVLVTMTAGSTLMVLAIGLVHQTLSLSSASRQRMDHVRSTSRLARQFRFDIHRATQCTVTTTDQLKIEMVDDSVVTYRVESNRVTRTQPTLDGRTRKAVFLLLPASSTRFSVLDDPNQAVVTVVRPTITLPQRDVVDRRIEAVVGRLSIHQDAEVPQ